MDFQLTKEQAALREEAREFANKIAAPGAASRDRDKIYPTDIVAQAAKRGWMGLLIPEEYGGRNVGNVGQCLLLEELARVDASAHVTVSVHNSLGTSPVKEFGTDTLKQRALPKLASGEWVGAYALTEPHCGSDAAALSTSAVRDGDHWVLNGSKMWITTGSEAGLTIVFARTDPDVPNAKGISAFAIERGTPGLTWGKRENKLGIRSSDTVQLFLEDVRVPDTHLLGGVNQGFPIALQVLNGGRIGIATQAVGIAQGAMDACLEVLHGRERNGRKGRLTQDEDFRLAEMATGIEASRLMTLRAAQLRDLRVDHVLESSMAKLIASETCDRACQTAVALLGPLGWKSAGKVERFFRDARVTELYEGTTEIQKIVISRQLGAR